MKRLVLLSDWKQPLHDGGEEKISKLIGKSAPVLGYIPSQTDPERRYFQPMKRNFERIGVTSYVYMDVDQEFDPCLLSELEKCDAIFLSGGNTFHFLACLQKRDMLEWLRSYVENGGVLIGLSAGAMVMASSIEIAELVDAKYVHTSTLDNNEALNLVDFHFYPHWQGTAEETQAVHQFAQPVIACEDGGGIIIDGSYMEHFGKTTTLNYTKK
ncbi:Type 1 glutamine amidotransferase-like domain-containing protein [Thalassobacillus hwangdonensis]|uniref:Type 1 glutamine amidotransferase-like domain-containing protein n=1 Tax=Thalassobacillus hwangdonensis TaxID=546108 RepID=A0ABW3L230_9BACI